VEKWEARSGFHFSMPPTAAELLTRPLRYTNNLAGTKDRAEHRCVLLPSCHLPLLL
jgi:hypothetical protein